MVSSRVYPDLERKPGGPDNWVEAAGGLPSYIERIAKHLHYERGFSISHAIATAVNTVKRWARGGHVTKYGTMKRVSPATIAKAAAAVASWEAKKKAGDLALSEDLLFILDLAGDETEIEEMAFDLIDLANADISDSNTMIALFPSQEVAQALAVEGGVPASELHVTVTFNGETDESQYNELVEAVKAWVKDSPMPMKLKGTLGGIGSFPPKPDADPPWFCPVDVPNLTTLHEQMVAVSDKVAPASEEHGYTPHMTLTYGGEAPEPIESTPVEFTELWVVRGNTTRTKIPFSVETGADETERAILGTSDVDLSRDTMDIQALAERANAISDPDQRALARQSVLDLASTIAPRNAKGRATDGRRSYDGQGKWKHGFVPVNRAAKEAKAKGSPIAIKRLNRIFGKSKAKDDVRKSGRENTNFKKSATGRVGNRTVAGDSSKRAPDEIKVDEKSTAGAERVNDIGFLRNTGTQDAESNRPTKALGSSQKEASKSSRVPERATQNWDEIPESLKTMRNGKRYVLAEFGGKQYVTEWLGGVNKTESTALEDRKVMRTLSSADAADMSVSELRALLNNPRTPDSVKKVARTALKAQNSGSRA